MWADRRAPSAPTWLLILAMHAGVLAVLNTRPRPAQTAPSPWSELRLIPVQPATAPATPPAAHTPRVHAPEAAPANAPFPTLPAEVAADPIEAPTTSTSPAQPLPPLRLTLAELITAARRQPALDDPRSNTPVSRFGARIANDLGGDGRWAEERMDPDFVRLRRGNTCINLHRNRTAGRQPFDEAAAPTPWGATPAYRCEQR